MNYQGELILHKVNEKNEALEGAEFILKHLETGDHYQAKVDKNKYIFTALKPGDYEVIEVQTPQGYLFLQEGMIFHVPESHEGAYLGDIEVMNERFVEVEEAKSTFIIPGDVEEVKSASILPYTGQSNFRNLLSLLLVTIGLVIYQKVSKD